jgi:hypothetical protein
MQHANTAIRVQGIDIVSRAPKGAADYMQNLTGLSVQEFGDSDEGYNFFQVSAFHDFVDPRTPYRFMSHDALATRFAGLPVGNLPDEGAVCISITVADIAAARAAIGSSAVELGPYRIAVPPNAANGVILEFKH